MTDAETAAATRIGSRRGGGRAARRAARAAPLPEDLRPVRAGLEGGAYAPLGVSDIGRVHETALRALEEIGLADAPPSGVEALTSVGAVLGDDGRIRIPRGVVDEMLSVAARNVTLCGQDPANDIRPGARACTTGRPGPRCTSTTPPSATIATRPCGTSTIPPGSWMRSTTSTSSSGPSPAATPRTPPSSISTPSTSVSTGPRSPSGPRSPPSSGARRGLDMLHRVAGSEAAWRARPFVSNSNCFVVPPLKFATESCEVMEALIRGGMPILLLSAGQAGATAPASLAGAVVQAVAECLAGVVYVNAVAPGHPAIFGTWPFVSDLRTGAMSGGSGEQALLSAACGQMARHYDLPGGSACAMSDSKAPDMQAGYERGLANVVAGLSGLNLVYESVGMHASLLSHCLESLVIDNDLIGACLRCVRGIEVNDDTLALEAMREVCLSGPGHYLGHEQTLRLMQSEYVYPAVGDRTSPKEWLEAGKPELLTRACEATARLLAEHFPRHVPDEMDTRLRAEFPIRIPRESMRPPR